MMLSMPWLLLLLEWFAFILCQLMAALRSHFHLKIQSMMCWLLFSFSFGWMVLLSLFMTSQPTPFLFCFNDHYDFFFPFRRTRESTNEKHFLLSLLFFFVLTLAIEIVETEHNHWLCVSFFYRKLWALGQISWRLISLFRNDYYSFFQSTV